MAARTKKTSETSTLTVSASQSTTTKTKKQSKKSLAEPKLTTAFNRVLKRAYGSELSDKFWQDCQEPLEYLSNRLHLTPIQCILLAILLDAGEKQEWYDIASFLGMSRLEAMEYSDEIENMVMTGWVVRRYDRYNDEKESFTLVKGVLQSILRNENFVPEGLHADTLQEFMDKLVSRIMRGLNDNDACFLDDAFWMNGLVKANLHLPFCQTVNSFQDFHHQSVFLLAVVNYASFAGTELESLSFDLIDSLFYADCHVGFLRARLENGEHYLLKQGYFEYYCDNGLVDNHKYLLTKKVKEELLGEYKLTAVRKTNFRQDPQYLTSYTQISPKKLFFNSNEDHQLKRLKNLLQQDTFKDVQKRLKEAGMRTGFACLFYGGPGTGKTESVLQLARETQRDIMQVDISTIRTKWVGDSEKNIKAVFERYRQSCAESAVKPILFFNEADAIIGQRNSHANSSAEKMDNALQNIILEELEKLDGILIATTNLTSNFDPAFERRFLYKIKFDKPGNSVKALIWKSMIHGLSDKEAEVLAREYDFSGGQIENVARKRTIDSIIYGTEATWQDLKGYCQAEVIAPMGGCRPKIGFHP